MNTQQITYPKERTPVSVSPAIKKLIELKALYVQNRYPNFPAHARPKPKYEDRTANGLTRCILDFVKFSGGYANRIQSQGQYRPGIGGRKGTYTYSTTRKGTADIHAIINGLHLSIEVKIGKDRMSDAQRQMQADIQKAGGIYYVARTFQEFYDWFFAQFPSSLPN
ncbi:VRR-NUC domain-containing protein [Spirosoma sp. BT702]|uniref:VRR-NUC domain-containing protein n=1 Tax=Spirosoma profusum TaxID=2771354 RepID=A0A927AW56_9BACT|nr:VRR-NUC domain-containing protein [Spirosoma profusum]MBD2705553.1 VRR-NUC domain-containing protein [Spirosoma profusum]